MSDFAIWAPLPRSAAVVCPYGLRATPPLPPGWAPASLAPMAARAWRPGDPPLRGVGEPPQAPRPRPATSPHAGGPTPPGAARRPG
jgi:hypothetical protein